MTTPTPDINLDGPTAASLADLLETWGPSMASVTLREDAAGFASELRSAIGHARTRAQTEELTTANDAKRALLREVPINRTVNLPDRDHEPGCAGNDLPGSLEQRVRTVELDLATVNMRLQGAVRRLGQHVDWHKGVR